MTGEYILTSNGGFVRYDELYHWGVKGMKWGVRRYQNKDGTLTAAGKKRKNQDSDSPLKDQAEQRSEKIKKAVKIGAAVAGTALAAYGAYKVSKIVKQKAYDKSIAKGKKLIESAMSKFDDKHVYGLRGKDFTTKNIMEGLKKSDRLRLGLGVENEKYARRVSKSIPGAISALLGRDGTNPMYGMTSRIKFNDDADIDKLFSAYRR